MRIRAHVVWLVAAAVLPAMIFSAAGLEQIAADVALVDIGLPGRDGYEFARELRRTERGRRIFLVAVTGYGQPEDHGKAIEAGFDGHLVKPVDPEQLAAPLSALPHG